MKFKTRFKIWWLKARFSMRGLNVEARITDKYGFTHKISEDDGQSLVKTLEYFLGKDDGEGIRGINEK